MEYNFNKEVKLFMIFDILGDTVRTGPQLWKIERERLERLEKASVQYPYYGSTGLTGYMDDYLLNLLFHVQIQF